MASNLDSSLRVSLHASEDLRRSLNSSHNLRNSTKLSPGRWGEGQGQGLCESRSSGVSLWSSTTTSSNTWPRSPRSTQFLGDTMSPTRYCRSSQSSLTPTTCVLHKHGDKPDVCPFDGSKYRLKPLPASPISRRGYSLAASPSSLSRLEDREYAWRSKTGVQDSLLYDHNKKMKYQPKIGSAGEDDLDQLMAELDEVFHNSMYGENTHPMKAIKLTGERSYNFEGGCNTTQDNGDTVLLNGSINKVGAFRIPDDKRSSCNFKEKPTSRKSNSYGNLSFSSSKFPSRISLHSTGSQETEASAEMAGNFKTFSDGREFRMQLEAKYEKYRETYLATSPEQELQTLDTGILSIRKWLRKRHTYLTNLSRSDTNRITENASLLKSLIAEAKKRQEGVDVLLDRGQRFLSVRANIVLEVDLENLVFLWNSYVASLRELQVKAKAQSTIQDNLVKENQEKASSVVSIPNSEEDKLLSPDQCENKGTPKEEISIEVKDKNSNSSGSSGSLDDSQDISFLDSGRLTLEDLQTGSAELEITDLTQEAPRQPTKKVPVYSAVSGAGDTISEVDQGTGQQLQNDEENSAANGLGPNSNSDTNIMEGTPTQSVLLDQPEGSIMEVHESSQDVMHPNKSALGENGSGKMFSSGKSSPSLIIPEKEGTLCDVLNSDHITGEDAEISPSFDYPAATFQTPKPKNEGFSTFEMKHRRGLLEAPANNISNQSSRSESPLSLDSSRSETPTGTLKRAERQNELWRAIGSIDTFLMDKDIIEACKSTAGDLTSEDEDCASKPNVSFAEFLQQYSELTDWLNQVQKVTQREVTSLSEKYLNQSYQEEMLERSPRRDLLNKYSLQLLRRYPDLGEQVGARMARLNTQWAALEKTVAPPLGAQNADTMLRDLESDLSTLRLWLNTIEARLLPLTIKADWTDGELEQRLQRHKGVQRDIESHNKIVNAVLKLSERLATQATAGTQQHGRKSQRAVKEERERDSLQLVAINLQRRWHGIWLHSLEWQCRLEEALTRRKGLYQDGLDFNRYSLSVLDESLFGESSQNVSDQGLIELDDESLLFVGHRADIADLDDSRSNSASPSLHREDDFALWTPDISDSEDISGSHQADSEFYYKSACGGSGATTPVGPGSPPRPILSGRAIADSPLGKRPYPDQTPGDASPAKRGSQSPLSSSGGASPVSLENPLDNFISARGLCINKQQFDHGLLAPQGLRASHLLFDRSSGDSANISECESKMGDSPPISLIQGLSPEHQNPPRNIANSAGKTEVKDVGYSSESQSNDEIEMMRHQIDMEYKFPGKCEVATDGPLGDKVMFPAVGVRPDYYCMTHVDVDSTTASDMTDSSGERGGLELTGKRGNGDDNRGLSDSLEDSWDKEAFGKQVSDNQPIQLSEVCGSDKKDTEAAEMLPMHQIVDFSESDSAPESGKKSIRYLIEHAEELVKPAGQKTPSNSPKKSPAVHSSIVLQSSPLSPSKQTQTDTCSTVESSCDASGEDNSDHDQALVKSTVHGEEFSTATDDADDTLFNSVINMESVSTPEASKTNNFGGFTYPRLSNVYDSARLRKQTGDTTHKQRHRREKKDRPWSVVGLQEVNCKTEPSIPMPIAASESAINKLHFHTDSDSTPSKSPFLSPSQSATFPRDHRSSHQSPTDRSSMSSSRSRRRHKHSENSSIAKELFRTSEGSTSTPICGSKATKSEGSSAGEQLQRSPPKTRRPRRPRGKSNADGKEPTNSRSSASAYRSSTTDCYDSAEADTESETAEEYLTAPMEVVTSEGDDVHNVSGSLSENSTWDNYQMVYPTASEDANEELLAWEPHDDDLEFDDEFQLARGKSRSIVTDVLTDGQQQQRRTKLKFTKQGVPCDDSDSDLEDFHHILDQSELQLRLVDQSLRKKRRDPMGTGLHPNPAKYSEIIVTYETNIRCLESICQHLNSEDVTTEDVKRVKDLMYQWEKVYALASERHGQTTALSGMRDKVAAMKANVTETEDLLSFDKFSSADGLNDTISGLKEKTESMEKQNQEIVLLRQQLTDFSSLHPTICVDKYLSELANVQKRTSSTLNKVKEHLLCLESQRSLWLEYLEGQQELDKLLTTDRDRLHQLLGHRESGLSLTKKDVLTELEVLQDSLSMYESKLAVLGAMRARLTQSSNAEAQQTLLASLADLRNQLLVVSQRCKQMYRDVEDDEDLPLQDLPLDKLDGLDKDSELGKLAMSAAALHEAFSQSNSDLSAKDSPVVSDPASPGKTGLSRSCAVVLSSLPVQVVALVLVAGLAYALDPEILDKLASFTLTVTPELSYVNGPPAV